MQEHRENRGGRVGQRGRRDSPYPRRLGFCQSLFSFGLTSPDVFRPMQVSALPIPRTTRPPRTCSRAPHRLLLPRRCRRQSGSWSRSEPSVPTSCTSYYHVVLKGMGKVRANLALSSGKDSSILLPCFPPNIRKSPISSSFAVKECTLKGIFCPLRVLHNPLSVLRRPYVYRIRLDACKTHLDGVCLHLISLAGHIGFCAKAWHKRRFKRRQMGRIPRQDRQNPRDHCGRSSTVARETTVRSPKPLYPGREPDERNPQG